MSILPYPPAPDNSKQLLILCLSLLLILFLTLCLGILYMESRDSTNRKLEQQHREHLKRMEDIKATRRGR